MMDCLDAHQIARIECLKLIAATLSRSATLDDTICAAERLVRFVMDGATPEPRA